jgi:hypothetical protein
MNLSVLEIGAPDTRAVQLQTSHSREFQGSLRYNSPHCPVCQRLPARQRLSAKVTAVNSAAQKSEQQKSEGTGLSGAARRQGAPMVNCSEP